MQLRALDLFCGVGGSSLGARRAGATILGGVDSSMEAILAYREYFPGVTTWCSRAESLDPFAVERAIGPVDLLLASPECTNHTCAKGAGARSEASRRTAFQVARYARVLRPRWIVMENVVHMRPWHRYPELLTQLRDNLGYCVTEQVLNAADFGVPQNRRRLFVLCDRFSKPREVDPTTPDVHRSAGDAVNLDSAFPWTPLRSPRRARATIERAERAIGVVGEGCPFLIVYYGTDGCGGWQRLEKPLRTVTTIDRFAIVRPGTSGHEMRMMQVPELAKAMGFPRLPSNGHSVRRSKVRLLGNAVCPPVMEAVVRSLIRGGGGSF